MTLIRLVPVDGGLSLEIGFWFGLGLFVLVCVLCGMASKALLVYVAIRADKEDGGSKP